MSLWGTSQCYRKQTAFAILSRNTEATHASEALPIHKPNAVLPSHLAQDCGPDAWSDIPKMLGCRSPRGRKSLWQNSINPGTCIRKFSVSLPWKDRKAFAVRSLLQLKTDLIFSSPLCPLGTAYIRVTEHCSWKELILQCSRLQVYLFFTYLACFLPKERRANPHAVWHTPYAAQFFSI